MSDSGAVLATSDTGTFTSRHTFAVTLLFGLAFCLTLVKSAWDTTLERKQNDFQYDILAIKQTVIRNVLSGNDVTNNIAAFIFANDNLTDDQFQAFAEDTLTRYSHLEAINYFSFVGNEQEKQFPLLFERSREKNPFQPGQDIFLEKELRNGLNTAVSTGSVVPTPPEEGVETDRRYWLFKAIYERTPGQDVASIDQQNVKGMVGILVSPAKTVGTRAQSNSSLTITMFSDTINLYGRKILYQSIAEDDKDKTGLIESFSEEELIQLPPYSVKIIIGKNVFLGDLEFDLVFVAFLLGVGIMLLMYGLMKARLQQEREMRERNKVIEQKVEEQTYELNIARDEAVKAMKMKSEFLASMSHEIRTPLNAIIGMSDLMSETRLSDEQDRYVNVFKKAGDALLTLVNDILDLSKIEAGQLVLEKIPLNLMDLIEEVADIYALKATDKNLEIITHIDTSINIYRLGDPGRLKQVILNLISNALKFTETGQVVVSLQRPEAADIDSNAVVISVRDTGIGIPVDKREAIFESFTQADTSTTRRFGGTGLGLTICRHLITLMGGRIRVESEEGKGSEFFVELPLDEIKKDRVVPPDLTGKTVLIVDSRIDNCLALEESLQYAGARCVNATSANNCIDYLEKETLPDIMIVDSELLFNHVEEFQPVLTDQLKARTLVTMNPVNMNKHPELIQQGGYYHFVMKPIKRKDLMHAARDLFDHANAEDIAAMVKPLNQAEPDKPKLILLVEDNPDNRMLIRAYLKKTDHTLEEAENGELALEKFMQKKYDMVFMDIQMPVMDGHEATKRIRAWEQHNNKEKTPIIALTAHAIKEEIDKCLASGCDSHLSKPVKKATLLQTIEETS